MQAPAPIYDAKLKACGKVLEVWINGKLRLVLTKGGAEALRDNGETDEPTRQILNAYLPRMVAAVFHTA